MFEDFSWDFLRAENFEKVKTKLQKFIKKFK